MTTKTKKLKPSFKVPRTNDKGAQALLTNVRLAFVSVASPNTRFANKNEDNQPIDGTFELTCLIPKKEGEKIIKQAQATIKEIVGLSKTFKNDAERKKAIKTASVVNGDGGLIKDGDKITNADGVVYDGLEGHYTFKAKAKAELKGGKLVPKVAFKVVDSRKQPIPKHELENEVYSGVWANVSINLACYKSGKNLGVTAYLTGVQKLQDDSSFGGVDLFDDVSDEFDEYDGADKDSDDDEDDF